MVRNRAKQLKFFVNDEELERIKNKVTASKLSQSDYLRKTALDREIVVIDGVRELVLELKRIGTNLNQLTKLSHQSRVNDVSGEMEQINKELKEVWQLLRQSLHAKRRS